MSFFGIAMMDIYIAFCDRIKKTGVPNLGVPQILLLEDLQMNKNNWNHTGN